MNNFNYLELLRANGSIILNKSLCHAIGINETIIFCELLSKYDYFEQRNLLDEMGYFWNTQYDLQSSTALSDKVQRKAIENLVKLGLIHVAIKGVPAKRHFKIIMTDNMLFSLINQGKEIMNSIFDKDNLDACGHLKKRSKSPSNNELLSVTPKEDNWLRPKVITSYAEKEELVTPNGRTNNTNINNTNNNTKKEKPSPQQISLLDQQPQTQKDLSDKSDLVISSNEFVLGSNKSKSKHKEPANSDTKVILDYFCDSYTTKLHTAPVINFGAAGKQVKELLKVRTADELKKIIDFYFDSKDQFFVSSGYTISKLISVVIPKYDTIKNNPNAVDKKIANFQEIRPSNMTNYSQRGEADGYDDAFFESLYTDVTKDPRQNR